MPIILKKARSMEGKGVSADSFKICVFYRYMLYCPNSILVQRIKLCPVPVYDDLTFDLERRCLFAAFDAEFVGCD